MSTPNWQRFEQLVAAIHHAQSQGGQVSWNDTIQGRQFDVTVRFKYGLHSYLTVIECKDKGSKVPVSEVDAFVTKARDVNANNAVMVSSKGYQSGCIPVAERHGVRLLILSETAGPQLDQLIKQVVPMLNIFNIRFDRSRDGRTIELDDVGGKLTYLIHNTKLHWRGANFTVHQVMNEWLAKPESQAFVANEIRVPFADVATVEVPHEDAFQATALKFNVKRVNGFIANDPAFDPHIMQSLSTDIELRSVDGSLVHKLKLSDVKFGFDTEFEIGKFYANPTLHINYYCEKIEGNLIHFIMLESYQHGMLMQAEFSAKREHTKGYVKITDKRTVEHLQKMLEKLNSIRNTGGR